jgi:hypothetical protein
MPAPKPFGPGNPPIEANRIQGMIDGTVTPSEITPDELKALATLALEVHMSHIVADDAPQPFGPGNPPINC